MILSAQSSGSRVFRNIASVFIPNGDMEAMTSKMARAVTDTCNELPFVNWDRFVDCGRIVVAFGWIDREKDNYKDFVCVEVSQRGYVQFTTSSAKYSETISDIYVKHGRLSPGTHEPCQRIEGDGQLAEVENVVRIRDAHRGEI